jgi:peptide/nickel transport system substrate-binding protein
VRQAIFWALDREQIRQISRPTTTSPLNAGFLPPTHWAGVTETVYKQDLDKARKLLADAGKPAGFKMEIMTLTGSNFHIRTAQAIQQQLKPINIEVDVKIVDTGQLTSARNNSEFHSMVLGFSGTIDPDERFQQTFMTGGGTNYVKFSDAKIDELATAARKTSNREQRAKLYREAQLRLADVGPYAFTYNYHFFDTLQKHVKGYTFNPQLVDYRSVRETWLDK